MSEPNGASARPPSLTLEEARALALKDLTQHGSKYNYAFYDADAQCKRYGWILFFNTREYIETGDFLHALGGNGPIIVMHDGTIHRFGTAKAAETTIADFEREHGL